MTIISWAHIKLHATEKSMLPQLKTSHGVVWGSDMLAPSTCIRAWGCY